MSFAENLNRLFAGMFRESISDVINDMIIEIKTIAKMQANSNLTNS